jgi:hypothetical protein
MAKIDKSRFTKSQWREIREQRRLDKQQSKLETTKQPEHSNKQFAFVLGNGVSRLGISIESLKQQGKVYACNAVYRQDEPDYLVAVDVKMVNEICKSGYQHTHKVWTNPNKSFRKLQNLNYFHPAKGWSSGPTALWLASEHFYSQIYILGFDFKGVDEGQKFNNVFANTMNYKKSKDGATFFGNWLRQTASVVKEHTTIQYTRVIQSDNFCPEELNRFDNLKTVFREDFEKIFNLK